MLTLNYLQLNWNIEILDSFAPIFENDLFTEYRFKGEKGLFLRVSKSLTNRCPCTVFIEPQLNMNRSCSTMCYYLKLQISVIECCWDKISWRGKIISKDFSLQKSTLETFVTDMINACNDLTDRLYEIFEEDPQTSIEYKD